MASAGLATPTAPTGQDAGALSSRKTPAARALMPGPVAACEPASISEQHLKDACQAQIRFREDAAALGTLKKNGSRARIREHVAEGLAVVQRLLGQSNTVHHINTFGRPDTQGGLVSVRIVPPCLGGIFALPHRGRFHVRTVLCLFMSECVRLTVMMISLCR